MRGTTMKRGEGRQGWYCRQFWLGLLTWVHWWSSGGDCERGHGDERRGKAREEQYCEQFWLGLLTRVTDDLQVVMVVRQGKVGGGGGEQVMRREGR